MRIFRILIILAFFISSAKAELASEADAKQAGSSKKEVYLVNALVIAPVAVIGLTKWDWGSPRFKTGSEGFFGKNTKYGGADKAGHFYTSYLLADLMSKQFAKDGIENAPVYGSLSSVLITSLIEVGDATSTRYGFSYEDQIANLLGAGASYLLLNYPAIDKKIDFRVEYKPNRNTFKNIGGAVDDYDKLRYFVNLKFAGFDSLANTPLRFFEFQASYRTRGYMNDDLAKKRLVSFGVGINISELIAHFHKKGYASGFFEYYQTPYTYVSYSSEL